MEDTERAARVRAIAEHHARERGPLLPTLRAVQATFGAVLAEDLAPVADVLNVSRAEVEGVRSFYHELRTAPPPAHAVRVCRGEACQAVGAEALLEGLHAELSGRPDVELGEVFCLGNCALGPSATIDGRLRGRVTSQTVHGLLGALGAPGPQGVLDGGAR